MSEAVAKPRCAGEPVSWLRLEQLALGMEDREAAAHLEACPACAAAHARITSDLRSVPALALPASAPAAPRRWWGWRGQAAGLAAVLALLALVFVRTADRSREAPPPTTRGLRVKGAGIVDVMLVRERDGLIHFDPPDVLETDRWKVQLTCASGEVWVDVAVIATDEADFPLPARRLSCGNNVAVPGAFRITGGSARVCIALAPEAPDRASWREWPRSGRCITVAAE